MKDDSLCRGCDSDFYNGRNPLGVQVCWSLKSARKEKRWKQGWWVTPDTPGALVQIETYHCHTETGRYAFHERLSPHAVKPVYLEVNK